MSSGPAQRKKFFRASLPLPPGKIARAFAWVRRGDVLLRVAIAIAAATAMWAVTGAWAPPFEYRLHYTPPRSLTARVEFSVLDETTTRRQEDAARSKVVCYYTHDPAMLKQIVEALNRKLFQLQEDRPYQEVRGVWLEFLRDQDPQSDLTDEKQKVDFDRFREILRQDENLDKLRQAIHEAVAPILEYGLLDKLQHEVHQGSQTTIKVHPNGFPEQAREVDVEQVHIGDAGPKLQQRLVDGCESVWPSSDDAKEVAGRLYTWLRKNLSSSSTLRYNKEASQQAVETAVAQVEPEKLHFSPGQPLQQIKGGKPLDREQIKLLQEEHRQFTAQLGWRTKLIHSLADFGMYLALYLLCGSYIYFHQRRLFKDLRKFLTLIGFVVVTVAFAWLLSGVQWRAELIPLVIFGATSAMVYRQELSLLLTAAVSLIVAVSLGLGLAGFVILTATAASAVLLTGDIRTRTRLIYVGLLAGAVAYLTTLGVGVLTGQPLFDTLIHDAAWFAFCTIVSGLLLTALLPFIEQVFDIQTDMSLLELGDISHPLLQELIRRAPGTYNHSINVASIGESAAEAIGANGLLVRVGAYFHDIGKMLKPDYFIENQGQNGNRHESLLPAMSTLVIIAHVKDGADLARQHGLPKAIIDFIEQHHGTTLVEFFFRQAEKQSESNPDGGEVDETSFRYPGPRPQTKEAAVMMLADAVESASRALSEPGSARIESLVREMAMKRLLDGQFDECALTLKELRIVEDSLIKSLIAVYHGRVKYPSPQSA